MGKWLPIISRVVTTTVFGEDSEKSDRHWNVVQNNGMYYLSLFFVFFLAGLSFLP